jgi:hypothetical protein
VGYRGQEASAVDYSCHLGVVLEIGYKEIYSTSVYEIQDGEVEIYSKDGGW